MMVRILHILACILLATYCSYGQTMQEFTGITEFSAVFLREKPDYTSELGTQALMGTPVRVIGREGYWLKVETPEPYTAWCTDMGVVMMTGDGMECYLSSQKYICIAFNCKIFSEPDEKSAIVSDMTAGGIIRKMTDKRGKPVLRKGYAGVVLPSGKSGFVRKEFIKDFHEWVRDCNPDAENITRTALSFLGIPYMWGGSTANGLDCSGFTKIVWFLNGILLPRNAGAQVSCGRGIGLDEERMPGDLLFFGEKAPDGGKPKITHVGIYLGDGRFIHSSHIVRISSLDPSREDYYENSGKLVSIRRIIGMEDMPDSGVTRIEKSVYYGGNEK